MKNNIWIRFVKWGSKSINNPNPVIKPIHHIQAAIYVWITACMLFYIGKYFYDTSNSFKEVFEFLLGCLFYFLPAYLAFLPLIKTELNEKDK